jgi:uncharacterized membrane protein YvlD (DUF360 family)
MAEILQTQGFWAFFLGALALSTIAAIILINRWKHPELYK